MFGQGKTLSHFRGFSMAALLFFMASPMMLWAALPAQWSRLADGIETSYLDRGTDRGIYLAKIDLSQAGLRWQSEAKDGQPTTAFVAVQGNLLKMLPNTAKSSSNILNPFPIFSMIAFQPQLTATPSYESSLAEILAPDRGFSLVAPHLIKQGWLNDSDQTGNFTAAGLSRDGKTLYIATAKHLPLISLSQCLNNLNVEEALLLQDGSQAHFLAVDADDKAVVEDTESSFYDYHAGGLDALLGTQQTEVNASNETLVIFSR